MTSARALSLRRMSSVVRVPNSGTALVTERLSVSECPIGLYLVPGPATDVWLHSAAAQGVLQGMVESASLTQWVDFRGIMADHAPSAWRLDVTTEQQPDARR